MVGWLAGESGWLAGLSGSLAVAGWVAGWLAGWLAGIIDESSANHFDQSEGRFSVKCLTRHIDIVMFPRTRVTEDLHSLSL